MNGKNRRRDDVEYGVGPLTFLGSVFGPPSEWIAGRGFYPKLGLIAAVLFVFLTGIFSFAGLILAPAIFSGFQTSTFFAALYGLFAFVVSAALVFGYFDFVKRKTRDSFDLGSSSLAVDREVLAQHYAQKNRRQFFANALFVLIGLGATMMVFWQMFGMYPSEVFYMGPIPLLLLWVVLLLFLPRPLLVGLMVVMFVLRLMIMVMGPIVLIYMVPYLLMFPLFAVMNFLILFGPLAFINIMQIKTILPGEGKLDEGKKVLGQASAMKRLEHALMLFVSEEGEKLVEKGAKPPRGILLKGPPGVGKTLFAKNAASMLSCPLVITQGSAYVATFLGIDILTMLFTKLKTNRLAMEYDGKAALYIDEADQLMMRRAGMTGVVPGAAGRAREFWRVFSYGEHGAISPCGLSFENEHTRAIIEERKTAQEDGGRTNPFMFPGAFGMGGMGSMAIFPFLTWLDGVESPPFLKSFARSKINMLLDVLLVVPPRWRVPPLKTVSPKVLFLAATNRPQVIDPALLREGRFGLHVEFQLPDEAGREEIIRGYLGLLPEMSISPIAHHPDLEKPETIRELARMTVRLSPADIEQILRSAVSIQYAKVMEIKWLMRRRDRGEELDELEKERLREAEELMKKNPLWNEVWATRETITDALATKRFGAAPPPPSTMEKKKSIMRLQRSTAFHEIGGHFLTLHGFCRAFQKPTFMSAVPRGEALGLVSHVPIEEREDLVQWMIEGLMRVSIGSLAAERIFLEEGDSGPGVSKDLENATLIALNMALKFGMSPRRCEKNDEERYEEIGETILSLPEGGATLVPAAGGQLPPALSISTKRRNVMILLGQAYVDSWRYIKKNKDLVPPIVENLLAKGELTGSDLEEVWNELDEKVQPLGPEDDTRENWPEMASENKFYFTRRKEAGHE